jgi:uncharacterized coiled-coil protein SlyX
MMERNPETIEDRLARLEGQYHGLSKELHDGLAGLQATLDKMRQQVEDVYTVKGGMLKSEHLPNVIQRMDSEIQEMHKQVIAISNQLQIDPKKVS